MWFSSILFGAVTAMGVAIFGFRRGIHLVMGMALNWQDNVLHGLFTVAGVVGGMWKPSMHPERLLEEFRETVTETQPVHRAEHEAQRIAP